MAELPAPCSRSGIARAGHEGDLRTLRDGLGSPFGRDRATALGGLARAGHLDRSELVAAVADPDPEVRRRAAGILGRPDGALLDADAALVRRLLDDLDPAVREWACWAAGERPDHAPVLVAPLVELASHDDDALVREGAVAALGSLGHPGGREAVVRACDDVVTVRRRAVLALVAFDGREVAATLRRLADDRDWQVRQAAEELADPDDPDGPAGHDVDPTV